MGFSAFAGINEATIYGTGQYLKPDGRYKLGLEKIFVMKTRKQELVFIAECIVLESASTSTDPEHKVCPPGAKRTWFQKMSVDGALPAIKEFAYALFGYSRSTDQNFLTLKCDPILEILMEEATNEDQNKGPVQPMRGRSVGVETVNKLTKEKKVNFTKHVWFPTEDKVAFPA